MSQLNGIEKCVEAKRLKCENPKAAVDCTGIEYYIQNPKAEVCRVGDCIRNCARTDRATGGVPSVE